VGGSEYFWRKVKFPLIIAIRRNMGFADQGYAIKFKLMNWLFDR